MPVKFENAKDAPLMAQQKQQASSSGAAAFSPTRRVGARGGPQLFAQKLFTLVEEEDSEIVEWLPDGLAFRVKDIHRFSCEVLEKYFNRECGRERFFLCLCVCGSNMKCVFLSIVGWLTAVPCVIRSSGICHSLPRL